MDPLLIPADQVIKLVSQSFPKRGEQIPVLDAILLAIQEKNFGVLVALRQLAVQDGMGPASIILARTIVETAVGLEYMQASGLEETMDKFWRFNIATAKQDLDYLREAGVDFHTEQLSELSNKVEANFDKRRDEFLLDLPQFRRHLIARRPKARSGSLRS